MSENSPKVYDEFIEKIEKVEPLQEGDWIILTVRDKYTFDMHDLYDAIGQYNKVHPELKGKNIPILILDTSTMFYKKTNPPCVMYCEACQMYGTPIDITETECGNCRSHQTRIFVEVPRIPGKQTGDI